MVNKTLGVRNQQSNEQYDMLATIWSTLSTDNGDHFFALLHWNFCHDLGQAGAIQRSLRTYFESFWKDCATANNRTIELTDMYTGWLVNKFEAARAGSSGLCSITLYTGGGDGSASRVSTQ